MVVAKVYVESQPQAKVVKVYGLLPVPPTAINDIVGLQDLLDDIYTKEQIDQGKLDPINTAIGTLNTAVADAALKSADLNTFLGSLTVNQTFGIGDGVFMTSFFGSWSIFSNCIAVDTGGGYFQIKQLQYGSSCYLNIGNRLLEFFVSVNSNNGVNSFPLYKSLFKIDVDAGTVVRRKVYEIFNTTNADNPGALTLLNGSANAVDYQFGYQGELFQGATTQFLCTDSTNPVTITSYNIDTSLPVAKIYLLKDIQNPVTSVNMYQGDKISLIVDGDKIREV